MSESPLPSFAIESDGRQVRLRLAGDLTIEHARDLHAALAAAVHPDSVLQIDAAGATRFDLPVVQVLIAAMQAVASSAFAGPASAWTRACDRFGIADGSFPPPSPAP